MEFSRDRKSMSVFCSSSGTGRVTRSSEAMSSKMFVKGAPEGILERCTKVRVGKDTVTLTEAMKNQIMEQVTAYGTGMWIKLFELENICYSPPLGVLRQK